MAERFLIVDDNEHFLKSARSTLEGQGLEVVGTAHTSAEGVRQAAELRPDVVLVDISLGDESGFDLARQLVDGDHEGRQVILISTLAEEDFTELIRESPAVGFLSKSDLSARAIYEVLRKAP